MKCQTQANFKQECAKKRFQQLGTLKQNRDSLTSLERIASLGNRIPGVEFQEMNEMAKNLNTSTEIHPYDKS